jgi:hypothetical protein
VNPWNHINQQLLPAAGHSIRLLKNLCRRSRLSQKTIFSKIIATITLYKERQLPTDKHPKQETRRRIPTSR